MLSPSAQSKFSPDCHVMQDADQANGKPTEIAIALPTI
jgi:hypothetical protein